MPLKNFSAARIEDGRTVGPAARRTMHPLNDVVANVQGVCAVRQHFDLKRILVSSRFKGLVPPAGALQQGRTYRLRCAAIQVVNYGFDSLAKRCRRVFLLKAVAATKINDQVITNRRCIVRKAAGIVAQTNDATARIISQWLIVVVRKSDK